MMLTVLGNREILVKWTEGKIVDSISSLIKYHYTVQQEKCMLKRNKNGYCWESWALPCLNSKLCYHYSDMNLTDTEGRKAGGECGRNQGIKGMGTRKHEGSVNDQICGRYLSNFQGII